MELYNAAEYRVYQNVTRATSSGGEIPKHYFKLTECEKFWSLKNMIMYKKTRHVKKFPLEYLF